MITLVVVEEEKKIFDLIADTLRQAGYSFFDEPASHGLIKIIKRMGQQNNGLAVNLLNSAKHMPNGNGGELYKTSIMEMEKDLISQVLARTDGNQLKAAKILGINRNTLRSKIKKLGINAEQWKVY